MKLLTPRKAKGVESIEADEKRIASLKMKRKLVEEQKSYSESVNDWDAEKRKQWEEFSKWNQEIQQRKAKILLEIEYLEHKRDVLAENLKALID